MAKNRLITVYCFGKEIGLLGLDEDRNASSFQYNPGFLAEGLYSNIFPFIIRRMGQTQVFNKFNSDTFRGLPPAIADSLPDVFGNIIFRAWLESKDGDFKKISALEQLAYVGRRGMGALEYIPAKEVKGSATIDISEITEVVKKVLAQKEGITAGTLDSASLLNIFKIGTSAGGMRPKILISEDRETKKIIPGDLIYSAGYDHYLVKLGIDDGRSYSPEAVEYAYYQAATSLGIQMMDTKMIDGRHFATLRFDRQNGEKIHALTATGLTGWDHKDPQHSSYENLFDLAVALKVPHRDVTELFQRMVFNVVFANHDDHLKNHAFLYNKETDKWQLAPAYDLTYSLNPEVDFTRTSRALAINGKRVAIQREDVLTIAEKYTIKNAGGIITKTHEAIANWQQHLEEQSIPTRIIDSMRKDITELK